MRRVNTLPKRTNLNSSGASCPSVRTRCTSASEVTVRPLMAIKISAASTHTFGGATLLNRFNQQPPLGRSQLLGQLRRQGVDN